MSEPTILSTSSGYVRIITLNRPAALNSFTSAMHGALMAELNEAAEDASVRGLVLTGAGRAFCAGQDLSDPSVNPAASDGGSAVSAGEGLNDVITRFYNPLVLRLSRFPVPVVVAVNGVAAGAGANLALCGDIVVAARSASFIQAFSKIGLIPDSGGTWSLPRLVGRARALGLTLLADKLSSEAAERMGLIWQCVDDADLQETALALAQRLAAMPVKALAATRMAFDYAQQSTLEGALHNEARVQRMLGQSDDYREGVAAFTGKRAPHFTDR